MPSGNVVRALEWVVHDSSVAGSIVAVIAGSALFCLYSRARVGDRARSRTEPSLDIARDMRSGYVETHFLDHKTARPGARRALPITASAFGLSQTPWAPKWLESRRLAGLRADS